MSLPAASRWLPFRSLWPALLLVWLLLGTRGWAQFPISGPRVSASPEPSAFESAVTLTASITGNGPQPTGTVQFLLNGVVAGQAPVKAGVATLTLGAPYPAYLNGAPLLPGTYQLTAVYSGQSTSSGTTVSSSHTVLLGPTSVVLTPTTPLTTFYGQPVDGTFAVSVVDANYGTTGTYTLFDNGIAVPICTNLPLTSNGVPVACPYGNPDFLDVGTHTFTLSYNGGPQNGDPVNGSSLSNAVSYVVQPDITSAGVLSSSANPSVLGQAVTFSATFSSNVAPPVGTVRFLDGTAVLGTGALNSSGVATLTTSTLAVGSHPITAVYDATTDFSAATSVVLNQVVNPPVVPPPPAFSLTVTPPSLSLGVGRTATFTVTVTGALPVTLGCSDSIPESTCTLLSQAIPAPGGSTELLLSTAAPHDYGDPTHPYFLGRSGPSTPGRTPLTLAALAGLGLLGLRRHRWPRVLLLALGAALGLSSLSGCGHCTDLGTRPTNYTFTVTATASDGSTRQVTVPVRATIPGE